MKNEESSKFYFEGVDPEEIEKTYKEVKESLDSSDTSLYEYFLYLDSLGNNKRRLQKDFYFGVVA